MMFVFLNSDNQWTMAERRLSVMRDPEAVEALPGGSTLDERRIIRTIIVHDVNLVSWKRNDCDINYLVCRFITHY